MISVVIPLYNKAQAIQKTLDSVLAQTYKDFEIVVVDDGSTDDSARIAEEYIREVKGERLKVKGAENSGAETTASCLSPLAFRLIRQPNGGVSSARNAGILAAKGEYVAFLDGDDLWHPEYLETLHQLICDYPDATIYGIGCAQVSGDNVELTNVDKPRRGEVDNIWDYSVHYWTGSSATCRKEDLLAIGMFDSRMTHGEDLDVWWRLLLRGKGAYDSTVLAYYRQDAENRAMNRVIPLEKHIPFYIDKYAEARANNKEFRRFFDREMIYRLYPYLFDKRYCKQAKALAKQMDYSLQKWTMKFRMKWPDLYKVYTKIKGL